jgi:hypothetical protein
MDGSGSNSAKGGQIATTILVMESAASIFAAFCPSWFTTRSPFFHEQDAKAGNIQSIRQGCFVATLLVIPTGVAASFLVGSWLPAVGSVAISGVMIAGYEYSIANPATEVEQPEPGWLSALRWSAAKS